MISVIIPCFNEQNTIFEVVSKVLLQENVSEVLVVDDFSTDNSLAALEKIVDPRLRILKQSRNYGKGAAIRRGFLESRDKFVLIQDADLEYDPRDYQVLLQPVKEFNADVVYGSRFLTSGSRRAVYFWHRVGNGVLTLLSNMRTNLYLTDMETGYKLIRADVVKNITLKENRFGIEPELTAKIAALDLRVYEVPISYNARTYDEGKKINWKDGVSAIRSILVHSSRRNRLKTRREYFGKNC
jgi:glycosyltransferase involved in cell wall biosynthesis